MKKTILGLCCLMAMSASVHAANMSLAAGADYWKPSSSGDINDIDRGLNDVSEWTFWGDFRHGIPLLPNVNLEQTRYDTQGPGLSNDLKARDLTLYYRLFDNNLFGIGGGITFRFLDGNFNSYSYSETAPMGYLQADVRIPGTTINVFSDARFASWEGDHSYDYRLGMGMEFIRNLNLRAGYRNVRLNDSIDGVALNQRMDGVFAGVEYRLGL